MEENSNSSSSRPALKIRENKKKKQIEHKNTYSQRLIFELWQKFFIFYFWLLLNL